MVKDPFPHLSYVQALKLATELLASQSFETNKERS